MSDDLKHKNRRERYAVRDDDGAGKGNRTPLSSLGSLRSTDELYLPVQLSFTNITYKKKQCKGKLSRGEKKKSGAVAHPILFYEIK